MSQLDLSQTGVSYLPPAKDLPLSPGSLSGLTFSDTPVTKADPELARTLRDLRALAQEDTSDPIAATGLLYSATNVIAALAGSIWRRIKASGRGVPWFMKTAGIEALKEAGKWAGRGLINP